MSAQPIPGLTPEQYLEIERAAEFKSEYYCGAMHAMAGGTYLHGLIIGSRGNTRTVGRPCYAQDSRSMASTGEKVLGRAGIPDLHGLIIAGGGDAFAVGRPYHSRDCVTMAAVYIIIYREGIF